MIAIYRGEDTDFAGAEPIMVKIDTGLDLTGYTADLLFGSIAKSFGTEDVSKKVLPLSFTAAETSTLFPGKGFAVVKVYDTEGRVAVLKKFVIDVRMRKYDPDGLDAIDVAEAIKTFEDIKEAAASLIELTEDDSTETVKETLNKFLEAARRRGEFREVIPIDGCGLIPPSSVALFTDSVRSLRILAQNVGTLDDDSDMAVVKETVNKIIRILATVQVDSLRDIDFSSIESPKSSVNSIREWADNISRILRRCR
jgi:hypothetical protein